MKNLDNHKVSITFDEIGQISGRDKEDQNNLPAFHTRNKRGIAKAWKELETQWSENITMYEAIHILDKYNLNCHSWCSMD